MCCHHSPSSFKQLVELIGKNLKVKQTFSLFAQSRHFEDNNQKVTMNIWS